VPQGAVNDGPAPGIAHREESGILVWWVLPADGRDHAETRRTGPMERKTWWRAGLNWQEEPRRFRIAPWGRRFFLLSLKEFVETGKGGRIRTRCR
jgi:hypothetical protein